METRARESLRAFLLRSKRCANCGLVDEQGGLDSTPLASYWYCRKHLDQRLDAARSPSRRLTVSVL